MDAWVQAGCCPHVSPPSLPADPCGKCHFSFSRGKVLEARRRRDAPAGDGSNGSPAVPLPSQLCESGEGSSSPVSGKASPCPSLALALTRSGDPAPGATRDELELQMCVLAAGRPWAGSLRSLVLYHFPIIRHNNACITGPPEGHFGPWQVGVPS